MNQSRQRWRKWAGVLIGLIVCYLMLRWFEYAQVYHPDRFLSATGTELGRPCEDVALATSDGERLHGWYFPALPDSPQKDIALLYCHGNGGNISGRLDLVKALLETGVNVFLFDYRGYGRSTGKPSEEGTYRDAQAAYAWLKQKGYSQIIVFGESLGGGVAAELAIREKVSGVILQSTFTSIPDIGAQLYPWLPVRLLATIHYDTASKLPKIQVPVVVMHSREDDLIGYNHAERNYAIANQPKAMVELRGGHNDPDTDRAAYAGGIRKMLDLLALEPAVPTRAGE